MNEWVAGALWVSLVASVAIAAAPPVGPPDATLRASDGSKVMLSRWRGKPVILFYEDRDSTTLNAALKEELFKVGRGRGLLESVSVVAVANLEDFDFFPAREFALSAVRKEEKRWGIPILVDLKGALGRAPWSLPRKTASVLVLDAAGHEVYRCTGRLAPADREAFFQALDTLLVPPARPTENAEP